MPYSPSFVAYWPPEGKASFFFEIGFLSSFYRVSTRKAPSRKIVLALF